jgi:hypothetical protein
MRKRERVNILSNLDTSTRKGKRADLTGIRSIQKSHDQSRVDSLSHEKNFLDETDNNIADNLLSQLNSAGGVGGMGMRGKTLSSTLLNIKESNFSNLAPQFFPIQTKYFKITKQKIGNYSINDPKWDDNLDTMCYWLEKNFKDEEIRDLLQLFKLTFNLEENDWVEPDLNDIPQYMHASHDHSSVNKDEDILPEMTSKPQVGGYKDNISIIVGNSDDAFGAHNSSSGEENCNQSASGDFGMIDLNDNNFLIKNFENDTKIGPADPK